MKSVQVSRIYASGIRKRTLFSRHAFECVFVPVFGRNGIRLVIHISPSIGPVDVVEEDHSSLAEQTSLPDQTQFIEDGVPVVVSIDENAIVDPSQIRKRIKTVAFLDGNSCVACVLKSQVGIKAGVNNDMRDVRQFQNLIGAEAIAGSDLERSLPTVRNSSKQLDNPRICLVINTAALQPLRSLVRSIQVEPPASAELPGNARAKEKSTDPDGVLECNLPHEERQRKAYEGCTKCEQDSRDKRMVARLAGARLNGADSTSRLPIDSIVGAGKEIAADWALPCLATRSKLEVGERKDGQVEGWARRRRA